MCSSVLYVELGGVPFFSTTFMLKTIIFMVLEIRLAKLYIPRCVYQLKQRITALLKAIIVYLYQASMLAKAILDSLLALVYGNDCCGSIQ